MKILGVDLGERRIGLAICDPDCMIASPLGMRRITNPDQCIPIILEAIQSSGASRVVIGHPLNMNGKPGPKALEAQQVTEKLQKAGIDAVLWDERLTTSEAERALRDHGMSRKQRRHRIDAVAAQKILASYLDSQAHTAKLSDNVLDKQEDRR